MNAAERALLQEAVNKSAFDPAYFLRFFFRKWFPTPFPPFHLGLIAVLTRKVEFLNNYPDAHDFLLNHFNYEPDPNVPGDKPHPVFFLDAAGNFCMYSGQKNNWMIPRGFSKTTIVNGCNIYDLVTDVNTFLIYLSETADHSETQLGNIKVELETNELLIAAYGHQVPTRSDSEKWTADQIQLLNGAIMVAKGRGGQVRGMNFRARRPNHIVLDDVEDEDSVRSPTIREQTKSWFYSSVEPAGVLMDGATEEDENYQHPLRVTNIGTLLSSEALCMSLAKDPEFNTVRFGACVNRIELKEVVDEKTGQASKIEVPVRIGMLWPHKMTEATYDRMRARAQRIGKLGEFTREYDSSIRVHDDTIFPSIFIYQPTSIADLVDRSLAMDPAISEQPDRDHATIVAAGRRASDGALWFLDEWGGVGKKPRETIDKFFEMQQRWQTLRNGIESIQYQKSLIYLMQEEMARRQYFFHIVPIFHSTRVTKDDRIVGILSPRYTNGYIRHLRPLAGLEGNLSDWPNGKKDYADAGAMALALLGETQMMAGSLEKLLASEHTPLEETLPPLWNSASNYIIKGARASNRYPVTATKGTN